MSDGLVGSEFSWSGLLGSRPREFRIDGELPRIVGVFLGLKRRDRFHQPPRIGQPLQQVIDIVPSPRSGCPDHFNLFGTTAGNRLEVDQIESISPRQKLVNLVPDGQLILVCFTPGGQEFGGIQVRLPILDIVRIAGGLK